MVVADHETPHPIPAHEQVSHERLGGVGGQRPRERQRCDEEWPAIDQRVELFYPRSQQHRRRRRVDDLQRVAET
jgi:hypothetical protein